MSISKRHQKIEPSINHFDLIMSTQTSLFPELFGENEPPKPVNVASVPQRSPFRYPGGKTWFVPTFRQWLARKLKKPTMIIEPFAGGGVISLTALFERLVEKAVMVELDEEIAAVWETVVNGEANWLADRILTFDLTKESIIRELKNTPRTSREKAFITILKNRTFHGGILAEGSGFLKYGEKGKGIRSRWYPVTLAKRFRNLESIAAKIDFRREDGLKVLTEFADNTDAVYFIDPPYTAGGKKAGRRLYKHYSLDHEYLFKACDRLRGDFLITYDNAEEVRHMSRHHGFQMRLIPMTNTHHSTMEELVIGKNLSWMDKFPAVHEPPAEYVNRTTKKIKASGKSSRKGNTPRTKPVH